MTRGECAAAVIVFLIAVLNAVLSWRAFHQKGFLFNNAYIYASKEEREKMEKGALYRQTAVVFLILSLLFAVIGLSVVLRDDRILFAEPVLVVGVLVYAIVSSAKTDRISGRKQGENDIK